MRRPLVPSERVALECHNLDGGGQELVDLLARTMFQVGLLIGGYPTAHVRVVLDKDDEMATLQMQVTMTVPLEELGPR